MKSYLTNIKILPHLYFLIKRNLKFQKQFMQQTIIPDIENIKRDMDSSLDEKDFGKITKYYGLAVPAILGESFCMLHGKRLTEKERTALTYLGGLTGLFDDFFDKKQISDDHIKKLVERHNLQDAQDDHERLFVRLFNKARDNITHIDLFMRYIDEVFNIQILSRQQSISDIAIEKIEDITYKKGGYSLLFYRSALDEHLSSQEEAMAYKLGSLMQLENDLFDVYKDSRDNINTLVTTAKTISYVRQIYTTLLQETFAQVHQTTYSYQNKIAFLRFISVILQRGMVCLDQLETKSKLTNEVFSPKDYTRKDLICDMEKPGNTLKTIHYYARCKVETQ